MCAGTQRRNGETMREFMERTLPFWNSLTEEERQSIIDNTLEKKFKKNTMVYHAGSQNAGLKIVYSGQVKISVATSNGVSVTLYRMTGGEICILSVICMVHGANMDITMEAEKDSVVYVIPAEIYNRISEENSDVKDFTQKLLTERLAEIMDIVGGLVSLNVRKRVADNLLKRMSIEHSNEIQTTHEVIAGDIGSAREVVSRTLKNFQDIGFVKLSRGKIVVLDEKGLKKV